MSFHPALAAEDNRLLVSQRPLNPGDLRAVARAGAVLLPQACRRDLYALAAGLGKPLFPRGAALLALDGKVGNHRLFAGLGLAHPPTLAFPDLARAARAWEKGLPGLAAGGAPLVAKGAGGGMGDNVFLVENPAALRALAGRLETACARGPSGLVLQKYLPAGTSDLRVVILGSKTRAYWRHAPAGEWRSNLAAGGSWEAASRPADQARGVALARELARRAHLDLCGVDVLCPPGEPPLLLEVNAYFGREALGGTARFLELYLGAVRAWLEGRGLDPGRVGL